MNIEILRTYCLSKQGTSESFPFDEDTLVFKVMNKMFAIINLQEADRIILKCDAERAIELRERHAAIEPAYHCNKRYWNQLWFERLDDALVLELIDHSYEEVVKKMPRKQLETLVALTD